MRKHKSASARRQAVSRTEKDAEPHAPDSINFHQQWMPWSDAFQSAFDRSKSMKEALVDLLALLKAGQLRSLIRIVDGGAHELHDHELQPVFWHQIVLRSAFGIRSAIRNWEMESRAKKALPDWWVHGSYHIYLKRGDIDRHFSLTAEPSPTDPESHSSRTRGRKPRFDWKTFVNGEVFKIFHFEGVPNNDYDLSKRLIKSCEEKFGRAPDERELRRYLAEVLRPAREFLDSP